MIERERLAEAVGADNVSHDRATLDEFSRDMSFVNTTRPQCLVRPKDASEVRRIVALANETLTPLVPASSGPPHFRGDTVPGIGGAVIVDMRRLKEIVKVDRLRRVAMVQAGVTFEELLPAVEKGGLRLNMPLLPRR